jgi:DNA-binding protein HU-beta
MADRSFRAQVVSSRGKELFVNKQELVAAVAKEADMTKEKAAEAVDAVFDSITAGLKQDGEVRLMGFGTFAAAKRAASTGRNPRTGAEIQIPASTAVRFKMGKALKDSVN